VSLLLLRRTLILSKSNYLLKAPLPNTTTLGIRASTHEFWRDTTWSLNTISLQNHQGALLG
jgi:hypothetical protein